MKPKTFIKTATYNCGTLSLVLLSAHLVAAQDPFLYTTNNGAIWIFRYVGLDGSVSVPDTVNGLPVTSFWNLAFSDDRFLTNVTVGDNVTNIANDTFIRCTNLTGVTMGKNVTDIGYYAFADCTSLPTVTLGPNVSSLETGAFWGCTSLTNVIIPSSVTNVGGAVFAGCSNLASITVDALNRVYSSEDGVLFDKSQTELLFYPPGKVGGYCIPSSVTTIAIDAFSGCARLAAITVDPLSPYFSSADGVLFDKDMTTIILYPPAKVGTSYSIPDSVAMIGNEAFAGCSGLTRVIIPSGVTNISHGINTGGGNSGGAFQICSSLTGVYFLGNAPAAASNTFAGTTNATVFYLPGATGWSFVFDGRPTALWVPQAQTSGADFGVRGNQFGFSLVWAGGMTVVVEACTDLANPSWQPVATNTLITGSSYFSDPRWTKYPTRFYRLRWP